LRKFGGDIETAYKAFLLFQDIKGVARGAAVFESDAACQSMGVHEAFNQFQGAAVVPMEFVMPVPRFLFKERLELADRCLAQVDNIHVEEGCGATPAAQLL
jgi:hypothetical protein